MLNIEHPESDFNEVTSRQNAELLPRFSEYLEGWERTVLDFGCGPGRFTPDLARLVGGHAIGVDPVALLLDLAPKAPGVRYKTMREGAVPLGDHTVDVIWVCLVLGGITRTRALATTVAELQRLLKVNGLLFVVENTTGGRSGGTATWRFRSEEEYQRLLRFAPLDVVGGYDELGERISIMAGRKAPSDDLLPERPPGGWVPPAQAVLSGQGRYLPSPRRGTPMLR